MKDAINQSVTEAVKSAIAVIGLDGLRKTSFFISNRLNTKTAIAAALAVATLASVTPAAAQTSQGWKDMVNGLSTFTSDLARGLGDGPSTGNGSSGVAIIGGERFTYTTNSAGQRYYSHPTPGMTPARAQAAQQQKEDDKKAGQPQTSDTKKLTAKELRARDKAIAKEAKKAKQKKAKKASRAKK